MLSKIQLALEVGLFLKSLPLIAKATSIVAFIEFFFLMSRVLAALLERLVETFPGVNQWINSLPVLDFLRIFRLSFQELNIQAKLVRYLLSLQVHNAILSAQKFLQPFLLVFELLFVKFDFEIFKFRQISRNH